MLLLGCKPTGRNTEQHDTLFVIGNSLKDTIPQINDFWPDGGKIHIDAWREITSVDGFTVTVIPKTGIIHNNAQKLFFLNLGGYKENEFEEFHYKLLSISADKAGAIMQAKQTAFYKHTGFKGADSHIDDKYGVDVDDVYLIEDILPAGIKEKFHILVERTDDVHKKEDLMNLGYFKLNNL